MDPLVFLLNALKLLGDQWRLNMVFHFMFHFEESSVKEIIESFL
jgi:hypothetical protein